jgi:hypothetical protein
MADRTLSTFEEPRNEFGPRWTITADRSASGQPGVLFTIRHEPNQEGAYPVEEMTVVVADANEFLAPVLEWLGASGG